MGLLCGDWSFGMLTLTEGFEPIEFSTDKNIRMLEQLNKTLELLQAAQEIGAVKSDRPTLRQKVEEQVLECIAMLCTPLIAVKETSA
jgi:hypothetical protein